VLGDEIAEAQTFIQLAHQNEAAVGGDARSLEIDLQRGIEGELKGLILFSPIGCAPPERFHRVETRMNQGVRRLRKAIE
jgi:hypothetical protein